MEGEGKPRGAPCTETTQGEGGPGDGEGQGQVGAGARPGSGTGHKEHKEKHQENKKKAHKKHYSVVGVNLTKPWAPSGPRLSAPGTHTPPTLYPYMLQSYPPSKMCENVLRYLSSSKGGSGMNLPHTCVYRLWGLLGPKGSKEEWGSRSMAAKNIWNWDWGEGRSVLGLL